jgi:zinc protease
MLKKNILGVATLVAVSFLGCSTKRSSNNANVESNGTHAVLHEYAHWKLTDTFEPVAGLKVYRYFHEPSGLEVLLSPKPGIDVVAFVTSYNVGSRFEQKGRTGLAHLFEHMMFRGTENFSEPFKTLSEWGDSFNAYTSLDQTLYHEVVPKKVLPELVQFESERMRKLKITEEVFNTERGAVVSERKMRTEDSPFGRLHWELYLNFYDVHPYRVGPIGWQDDLNATKFKDALDFYKKFYAPNRASISVVGDFKVDEILLLFEKNYGSFVKEKWIEPNIPQEPTARNARRKIISLKTESVLIADAALGTRLKDSQAVVDSLFCYLISDNKIGYLPTELVEKGIARSVNSDCSPNVDRSINALFVVGNPGVTRANLEKAYDKALLGFDKWLTPERIETAKMFYLSTQWSSLRDPANLAEQLASSSTMTGDPLYDFKFINAAQKVNFNEVKKAFWNWRNSPRTRVIVEPGVKNTPFKKR